jgi:hypothetical protein
MTAPSSLLMSLVGRKDGGRRDVAAAGMRRECEGEGMGIVRDVLPPAVVVGIV